MAEAPGSLLSADHRTILFLVDDLSMEMPEIESARMSLQKFVERQMQPNDLVAIMQTTGGNAGTQPFSSDKRQLLSRISKIRWNPVLHAPDYFEDKEPLDPIQQMMPQIMAIDYTLRTLGDVPGRKFLMFLSTRVMLPDKVSGDPHFDALADQALRSGVVIHTLDILGLINDSATRDEKGKAIRPLDASVGEDTLGGPAIMSAAVKRQMSIAVSRRENRPVPLSEKTGGIFLTGRNFFVNGMGDADEEMKGYYLLSFIPPAKTFSAESKTAYHKVKIKVKRPGCEVRTRDGYYGTLQASKSGSTLATLGDSMFSPFLHHDLTLNLAAGYIHDPQKGYQLRAWLHLDGRNIKFRQDSDGGSSISLEAVATTSDVEGLSQDFGRTRMQFRVNEREIEWIRENGIQLALTIPTRKPGAHYVRAAVKDEISGAVGSTYQFIEIPDLRNGRMQLSSIFLATQGGDEAWIKTGESENVKSSNEISKQQPRRNQAMRSYFPGDEFECFAFAYNTGAQGIDKPELELQTVLFANGTEVSRSKPEKVNFSGLQDVSMIPIRKHIRLEKTIQPGSYVLQLIITDKRAGKEKERTADQTLDLEITSKSIIDEKLLAAYENATSAKKSVLEMTPDELRYSYPMEFSGVKFNFSQDSLKYLLEQAGNNVVSFFHDFANTSAKEQVRMQFYRQSIPYYLRRSQPALLQPNQTSYTPPIVSASGTVQSSYIRFLPSSIIRERFAEFSYLIIPGSGTWVEDRKDKNGKDIDPKILAGFITSSGHAGKSTYLHPTRQKNSSFRYLGRDESKNGAYVIAFAQKPEAEDYLAQYSDSNGAPPVRILVEGFVWLDPENFQILRMRTDLLKAEVSTALRETITDIRYEKVRFERGGQEFWLPREINVSWELLNPQGWLWVYRNQHKYSDYHLFSVNSDYTINPSTR